jgi:aryl-alcohol dehydrogenase-like predicted oxidoreductase
MVCSMNHEKNKIQANFGGNSTKSMKVSVAASLKKLQTSYIDILYVHWWDYTVSNFPAPDKIFIF